MGINIQLEDECGVCIEKLEDPLPSSLQLHNLLFYESTELPLVSGIDPYGDTVFNRQQMKRFLSEWSTLSSLVTPADRQVMDEVKRMAEICRESVHTYLRFIGD